MYAIAFKYPEDKILIKSLNKETVGEIKSVNMLGSQKKMKWEQTSNGLEVTIGNEQTNPNGYALKVEL